MGKKTRTIVIEANEIQDAEITAVSLVKRGANRVPFKIQKSELGADEPYPQPQDTKVQLPDNGGVDDRYPQGRVPNQLADDALARRHAAEKVMGVRKDHSLDGLVRHAWRRRHGGGW